jgi:hypothetical protein
MKLDREYLHQLIDKIPEQYLNDALIALNEFITNNQPEYLYHYTDQKGFLGILKDKKIWATNFRYLNDFTELSYVIDLAFKHNHIDEFNKNEFYNVKNVANIAVCSLSANGDLLSQWRGYCPKGGYAIGFNFQKIKSLLEKMGSECGERNFELIRCIYNEDEQLQVIDKFKKNKNIETISFENINLGDFIKQLGLVIKHLASYLEIDLNNGDFPISKIKVGPCRDKELAKKAVEEALNTIQNILLRSIYIKHTL